jgi:hydroxymethylglutaryl-CoA reductase
MILTYKEEVLEMANKMSRTRKALDLEVRLLSSSIGRMLIVELFVDVRDSMGANLVNSMCEAVAPFIENLSEGRTIVRVLSNLATKRMVHIKTVVEKDVLEDRAVDSIVKASNFAAADPYRAATHNKGIMDGVSSVLLATSNDTRAVEAGAHAYAALKGRYRPLSTWSKDERDNLQGELKMPMQVGIIGGTILTHPTAKTVLKILGVKTSNELGEIAASTGLAYNLAVLNALVQ